MSGHSQFQVLVVEDDPSMRELISRTLTLRGYEVTACGDAESGWAAFQGKSYPLVLLDWMLPGMQGDELCRRMRACGEGADTVILMVTARQANGDLEAILKAGADDYLAKPITPAEFGVRLNVMERQVQRVLERRQIEHQNSRLGRIIDQSSNEVYVLDVATLRIVHVNRRALENLGYALEELQRMTLRDLGHEVGSEAIEEIIVQLRHGQRTELRFEMTHRRKDKSIYPVEAHITFSQIDSPPVFVYVLQDITERKRAERTLRAAEEQFRGLVEQSIAGIYIIQDGRFAYVNPRYAEIFGYDSAQELIGRDPLSLVAEKDRTISAKRLRQRLEGEAASTAFSFTGLRKDGAMIDVGVQGARATHRGRPAVIGLMQDISEKKRSEEKIQHYIAQLENAFMRTVEVATTLSEMRDPYTAGHERRVGEIAASIGAELGFDARRQEGLRVAGHLHDIGKIIIPSEILSKPGKLTPLEFEMIKGHPKASFDVMKDVQFPWPVAQVALQHHERIDGSGYPTGLKGEEILLEARIMAVADVIEAMSSHRPYRPGLGIDKALAEIERGRGTAYDIEVVDACLKMFQEKRYQFPT